MCGLSLRALRMPLSDKRVQDVFFELLKAGLWENEVRLLGNDNIEYQEVYRLAEYQSVVGFVASGIEHVTDVKLPQSVNLQFVGATLQLEQRNRSMNEYLRKLITQLHTAGITAVLLKGQGLAQCYEKSFWRACGDIDLFLREEDYEKAKHYLMPFASSVEPEETYKKHLAMTIDGWMVELHGNLYSSLSRRIERTLDEISSETFQKGEVRPWDNDGVQVTLMSKENDAVYVFTHILQHYFHGGIGLRQICDWCRLLWTYRDSLNHEVLESRIWKMGLMTEWKTFAYFAVTDLGMPENTMPLYENKPRWQRKAFAIKQYVMKAGNFGHRDLNYVSEMSYMGRKAHSFKKTVSELFLHMNTFPMDSIRFFAYYVGIRVAALARGE